MKCINSYCGKEIDNDAKRCPYCQTLLPGYLINNRYQLSERLGQGGMGMVYNARDHELDRDVAIKVMLQKGADDERLARLRREGSIMAKIDKIPHSIVIYDIYINQEQNIHCLIMEYIKNGETLRDKISNKKVRSLVDALPLVKQLAEGLLALHNKEIIHRDIKPNNIMVKEDGSLVIMDFGLARGPEDTMITGSQQNIGTWTYASPEQCRAEQDKISFPTDIYSFGLVVYNMLGGQLHEKTNGEKEIINIIDIERVIPAEFSNILKSCLSLNPDGRPAAKDLVDHLAGLEKHISFRETQLSPRPLAGASPSPTPGAKIWKVPFNRNPNFTGREEHLALLDKDLHTGKPAALIQAVAGLGGVGKTQIALEYSYRHQDEYDIIWWLRAEEPMVLASDYAGLADVLNLPQKDQIELRVIVQAVRNWLEQNPGWLLVFDNAELPEALTEYIPQNKKGHIIITSRNPNWGHIASVNDVQVMKQKEAVEFIIKRTKQKNRDSARDLAKELGCLPLALEQAGAYIVETRMPVNEYLTLFRKRRKDLLSQGKPAFYDQTIATTWDISMEKVTQERPEAMTLMNLLAFLAPDNIPLLMIQAGAEVLVEDLKNHLQDELAFNDDIAVLLRYSMIERQGDMMSVHRLVQAVVQDLLPESDKKEWAHAALCMVNNVFPVGSADVRNWPLCKVLFQHAASVTDHAQAFAIETVETAWLLNLTGLFLTGSAEYSKAEPLYQKALEIRQKALGPDHTDTALSLINLAELYRLQGRYAEAEPMFKLAYEILKKASDLDHPEAATLFNNLASLYHDQGRYREAEPLYQSAHAIWEKSLGPDHPETATSLHNLAELYSDQGRYAEAEPLYHKAYEIRKKAFGLNHPEVATSLNNLASLYHDQGRYKEAEPLYQSAHEIWEKSFGTDHPNTASSLNNLAELYRDQGRYAEAEPLYHKAHEIRKKVLGPDHPITAQSLHNLAALYRAQGRLAEAEPLYQKALEIWRKSLGPDHPDTISSLNNLARLYIDQGRYAEAEPLLKKMLETREKSLGPDHPDTARSINNLAVTYCAQGRYADAELMLQKVLKILESRSDPRHSYIAATLKNIAAVYRALGRDKEAEDLEARVSSILAQKP